MTDEPARPDPRRLQPISPAALTACAAVGLVAGWLLHPVAERVSGTAPVITWGQPVGLAFVAAVLLATARTTRRTVEKRQWLEPHRAVNRLVLARSCALVGALVAGGYLGYAVSWLGVDAGLATERIWRSVAAGAAGVAIAVAAVLLERACRVPSDEEDA